MRLSDMEMNDIAQKTAMKVFFDKILDTIMFSTSNKNLEYKDLLTRNDLLNTEHKYNLKSKAIRLINDITSVESWI